MNDLKVNLSLIIFKISLLLKRFKESFSIFRLQRKDFFATLAKLLQLPQKKPRSLKRRIPDREMNEATISAWECFFWFGRIEGNGCNNSWHNGCLHPPPPTPAQQQSVLAANPNILYLQKRRKRPFLLALVNAH